MKGWLSTEDIRRAVDVASRVEEPLRWAERQAAGVSRVRHAAVLVPVLVHEGRELELLFIVRPDDSSSHPGQVAFPGGVAEEGDDGPIATALRETEEELGIDRRRPEVVGMLPALPTHTGFIVRPIVGLIHGDVELTPSAREVAATFSVPLSELLAPERRRTMRSRWGPGQPEFRLNFWPFAPTPIWGATGHMVADLMARLAR